MPKHSSWNRQKSGLVNNYYTSNFLQNPEDSDWGAEFWLRLFQPLFSSVRSNRITPNNSDLNKIGVYFFAPKEVMRALMAEYGIKVSSILFFCWWLSFVVNLMDQVAAGARATINGKRGRGEGCAFYLEECSLETAQLASASVLLPRS